MSFEDALRSQIPPDRVGEVRLRFDATLLIGERPKRRVFWPELFGVAAVGCGVAALATLLTDGSLWLALALAVLAALGTAVSVMTRGRVRTPERFILNFGTETLRLDAPTRLGRVETELVPFDSVRDLRVVSTGRQRYGLLLEFAAPDGTSRTALLVHSSPASEIETLRRVWRILRHAFGLRPSPG